ncbi:MAG: GntR family transcriptional regulator [Clostridia bacterium]|nr:GntR family transcriptional regulator [Clostridia bacterium]
MNLTLDKSRPICPQICENISVAIASGEFSTGEKLPSVREIALCSGVNPNTVQKAYDLLEKSGVIHSVRCSGWYVNDDVSAAVREVESLRKKKTEEYLCAMQQLGCDYDTISKYIIESKGGTQ